MSKEASSVADRKANRALLPDLLHRIGLAEAKGQVEASDYSPGLVLVIDAVASSPNSLWRPIDVLGMADVVSVFNLNRVLSKTVGFDFAELVDRARLQRAVEQIAAQELTLDEIAEAYWPPRTRAQQIKEQAAQVYVEDNKLSSRENLDATCQRILGLKLDEIVERLRP